MSKAFLIVLLILVVLFLLLYPFFGALIKDKKDLIDTTLAEKYSFFFKTISDGLFNGKGEVYPFDDNPKAVNMMSTDPNCQNMIVHFLYSTGNMIMEVGFKYYRQELRFQHTAYNLREGSVFTQKDLANAFVEIAKKRIYEHKLRVTQLLGPDQIVSHFTEDKPFDEKDGLEMIEGSYSSLSDIQKQALICVGYLAATANGDPEFVFLGNTDVRQQLRYLNVSWEACKGLLDQKGEDGICQLLDGIDENVIAMAEGFFTSSCVSVDTGQSDPVKMQKLHNLMDKIGIGADKFDEIAAKNRAIMEWIRNMR